MPTLQSTRFGTLSVPETAIIDFPCGLIGLPGRRYALLEPDGDRRFGWLHSAEHPEIAVPVTDPRRSFESFALALSEADLARIGARDMRGVAIYVTIRVDGEHGVFTANLRAPLAIADGIGHQVVNHAGSASLRTPIVLGAKLAA